MASARDSLNSVAFIKTKPTEWAAAPARSMLPLRPAWPWALQYIDLMASSLLRSGRRQERYRSGKKSEKEEKEEKRVEERREKIGNAKARRLCSKLIRPPSADNPNRSFEKPPPKFVSPSQFCRFWVFRIPLSPPIPQPLFCFGFEHTSAPSRNIAAVLDCTSTVFACVSAVREFLSVFPTQAWLSVSVLASTGTKPPLSFAATKWLCRTGPQTACAHGSAAAVAAGSLQRAGSLQWPPTQAAASTGAGGGTF